MTKQHKATPEQWANHEKAAGCVSSCILELRARVEALEATQHAHVDTSRLSYTVRERIRQELSWPAAWQLHKVATETTCGTAPDVVPSISAGSLVDRVVGIIGLDPVGDGKARAAIREVAAWLKEEGYSTLQAEALAQEANR